MLVLTRKLGEVVLVGKEIRIEILRVSGTSVRLGFTAPDDVSIRREELDIQLKAAELAEASVEVRESGGVPVYASFGPAA